jgi:hypothetical protein
LDLSSTKLTFQGGIQKGTATAAIQAQPAQIMGFSEDTTREIERHQKMVEGLEAQRRMREISVPTNDDHVKARLVELSEPIILFGEEKPDRRERYFHDFFFLISLDYVAFFLKED